MSFVDDDIGFLHYGLRNGFELLMQDAANSALLPGQLSQLPGDLILSIVRKEHVEASLEPGIWICDKNF